MEELIDVEYSELYDEKKSTYSERNSKKYFQLELLRIKREMTEINKKIDALKEVSSIKDVIIWTLIGFGLGLVGSSFQNMFSLDLSNTNGVIPLLLNVVGFAIEAFFIVIISVKVVEFIFRKRENKNKEEIALLAKEIDVLILDEIIINDRITEITLQLE